MSAQRFIANGRERLLRDPRLREELERAVSEIEAKYAPLLQDAGFFRRVRLRRQMKEEIRREVELRAPSGALYVRP